MNEAGIVENLVTQFSSALDCFRELVQNSIDAGSPIVDVWMEFERGEGHQGVIAIHVDDFGEGMDEAIIDSQLTRLFASTKENDLTKIGKFGIGFVSVFALEPKGVLVHTGRGGEYWEVFFHEDRSFSKTRLDMPVEGTQITIFLEGDYHRYRELVEGVRDTLKHWCSHSETEVTFEDRSPPDDGWGEPEAINEVFEVPGECLTHVTHQGTEVVMAYTREPMYGFYNRGLTLAFSRQGEDVLFERERRYRHIAFKIKSRYLEHTLSRETVMRDANYEKAMVLLDAAADGELLGQLVARIEQLVEQPRWGREILTEYARLMGYLASEPVHNLEALEGRRVVRFVDGKPTTLARLVELWERDGRLLVSHTHTELSAALGAQGSPVLFGAVPRDGAPHALQSVGGIFFRYARAVLGRGLKEQARGFLSWLGVPLTKLDARLQQSLLSPERVYLPVTLDEEPPAEALALVEGASRLLREADTGYKSMTTCKLAAPVPDPPLFVVAPKLAPLMARPPVGVKRKSRLEVAVNRDHRHFKMLAELFAQRPEMATYCLAKDLLLDEDRLLERDTKLMELARGR